MERGIGGSVRREAGVVNGGGLPAVTNFASLRTA